MKVVFQAGCGREELDAAIDEALRLKRFSKGATAAELADELDAPLGDVIQAQVRRATRESLDRSDRRRARAMASA